MLAAVGALGTAAVTGVFGVLAAWLKARADKEAQINPSWASFAEAQQKQNDSLQSQISTLKEDQKSIRGELEGIKRRYKAAIGHIFDFRKILPPDIEPPPVPEILKDDLN